MVFIPAGDFAVGTSAESATAHLDGYCIGRFDVTNAGNLPVAKVGDDSTGMRLTINVAGPATTIPAYLDFVFVRVGDAVSGLVLFDVREPFDRTEQVSGSPSTTDLAGVIADRMASAR